MLALICADSDEPWIPLIQRPAGQGVHGGQLALPGGAFEPIDGSLVETALREANEEIGLDPAIVEVLGRVPDVRVPVSRFVVTPYVAWTPSSLNLQPHDREVESVVRLSLAVLTDPTAVRELPAPPGSLNSTFFEFDLDGLRLWGATARMLVYLARILQSLTAAPAE